MARDAEWGPAEIDSNIPQEEQDAARENLLKISTILEKPDNEFSLIDKNIKEFMGKSEERLELIRTWGRKLKEIIDSAIPVMEAAHKYLEVSIIYTEAEQ